MSARHHQPASGKFRDKQLGRGVSKDYRHYLEVLESRQLLSATLIGTFNTPVTAGTVGMVVGDFNGDGKLDVATDNTSVAHVDVMLGHGDGTFSQPVSYFDGAQGPSGLIVGDFTGDGKLDLGVEGGDISTFAPVIHILTGNGDGTFNAVNAFPEPMTAQLGNYGSPVAVDVNGDGKADLVTTNPSLGTVGIMLSNGDGTFQFNVAYAAVTNAVSVASGDFNHDGKIDLAVNGNGVAILLGKGDGTFAAPQAVTSALSSFPIAAGDINADGNLDLLVGNTIWLGNGDGTFQESATQLSSGANLSLVDLNGDGAADVITNSTAGEIGVQINNGDGTFAGEVDYADQATNFFSVGDFNGDGRVDLAGFNAATSQLNIIPGNGDGTLQAATIFGSGDTNNPVAGLKLSPSNPSQFLADFNGDGIQDMAVSNPAADKISISLGNADGTFQPALTFVPPNVGTQPHPQIVSAGDFDGDGKADLIIYNPGLPEQVILGGGETHAPTRIIPGTSATWTLFLSNGDGSFRASTVSNALFAPSLAVITTQAD
ncbi:MAG TPA: VCBS repeat-containing protein, partial [Tepidisphaeraceae bacterium]|nr:VCBS repeat-containing protein [Tepidisphaeraceae bacterium]